ncbi:MAG: hypothetical protein RO257_14355 [Candidatus Kapabacteria bacterium]|nr:hypothetical protein [Candidatus Kapabacteria bacterium]
MYYISSRVFINHLVGSQPSEENCRLIPDTPPTEKLKPVIDFSFIFFSNLLVINDNQAI